LDHTEHRIGQFQKLLYGKPAGKYFQSVIMGAMKSRLVWTSDPEEAKRLRQEGTVEARSDVDASKQTVRVVLDRKRRAGKLVTIAGGFQLTAESLAALGATLKKKCGAGGTAKDSEIEIQGDHAERVAAELERLGYRVRR